MSVKHNRRHRINFTIIAVVVLNQNVRPFSAEWHPDTLTGVDERGKTQFRAELRDLQTDRPDRRIAR